MKKYIGFVVVLFLYGAAVTQCKNARHSFIYEYIDSKAENASDSAILKAIDSAAVHYELAPHEVEELKTRYHIQ